MSRIDARSSGAADAALKRDPLFRITLWSAPRHSENLGEAVHLVADGARLSRAKPGLGRQHVIELPDALMQAQGPVHQVLEGRGKLLMARQSVPGADLGQIDTVLLLGG